MKAINVDKIPAEAFAKMRAKAEARGEPINNTQLVREFRAIGGQLLHIRPAYQPLTRRWSRGMTAAFVVKGSRVTMATAIVHTVDNFSKKHGTKTAIEHYLAGRAITLPLPHLRQPVSAVKAALSYLTH